ncbi:MAG: hypothetical protein KDD67_04620 [Ignavibacteriae bacterium]|nr:hypothetical protein [Ignavibacteriota bacterium]MCB9216386.1 hypothetical protein [Ignavibacteria bacterium]
MQPNNRFTGLDLEFWANVKLLNQRLGYAERRTQANPNPGFIIPTKEQIIDVFEGEGLNPSKLVANHTVMPLGVLVQEYMEYRSDALMNYVKPNLMDQKSASELFESKREELSPLCPLPMNKQKGDKRRPAFLTGLVNMHIEAHKGEFDCDYNPKELTSLTSNNYPIRTMSRRVDGAFPSVKDPIAVWEIKEYYYTTTFGSRVADGVYETQLDGWELREARENLGQDVKHYLIVDDYFTWWHLGRSYLCRLIDSMHMNLVSEVIFGKEVVSRIPVLVNHWKSLIIKSERE